MPIPTTHAGLEIAVPAQAASRPRWADYLELTKPRLNFLVVVTTAVAFYMGVRNVFGWFTLLHALAGTAMTAGAAAALNMFVERRHDAKMPRTANRPLPAARIAPREALTFGLALGAVGIAWLWIAVNGLTAALGAFTLVTYIAVYTPLKRVTTLNTVVGAVPGALPFVMGWTAARGRIDAEALVLFGIQFLWQMPHFLAIATLYRDDYARGGFRMLPVIDRDLSITSRQIVFYTLSLLPVSLMPTAMGMTGAAYFVIAMLLGAGFMYCAILAATGRTRTDARRLFIASILYLPLLLAAMMIDKL